MVSPTLCQNVSERIALHLRPFNFAIAHKPTKSLRGTLVNVNYHLPILKHIPCSGCPNAYVGQADQKLSVKEHKGAVRRRDGNVHCLSTGHALNWGRACVMKKGTIRHPRDFIEAWKIISACVTQCVTLDPGYRALRDNWRRRRQAHIPIS